MTQYIELIGGIVAEETYELAEQLNKELEKQQGFISTLIKTHSMHGDETSKLIHVNFRVNDNTDKEEKPTSIVLLTSDVLHMRSLSKDGKVRYGEMLNNVVDAVSIDNNIYALVKQYVENEIRLVLAQGDAYDFCGWRTLDFMSVTNPYEFNINKTRIIKVIGLDRLHLYICYPYKGSDNKIYFSVNEVMFENEDSYEARTFSFYNSFQFEEINGYPIRLLSNEVTAVSVNMDDGTPPKALVFHN